MGKVQPCRNGCGKMIQVMQDLQGSGKWMPYEQGEDNEPVLHNCPNSPYNQKQKQGQALTNDESNVHYQILQEIRKTNEYLERTNRLLLKIAGIEE